MNPIKKVCCRAVQFGFRAAIPILPYHEPELFDSIEDVVRLLHEKKVRSVLLVTDRVLRGEGITQPLERLLAEKKIKCAVYDRTNVNPTVDNVEDARKMYINGKCEYLIAFGGGSSIDCAKAAGARIAYPHKTLDELKGLLRVWRKLPPLIVVPTTAGTGSEVTVTAVITDSQKRHKYTMNNFTMIPSYAVQDPVVTYTLPPSLTSTTGMDALTHAVEAYIGRSTTKETRALALEAARLVFENVETAYREPENYEARKNMLQAAYKAGVSFTKSYVGYIHAIAHSLGGQYHTPHGLANAILMPYVLEAYGPTIHDKLHELGVAAGVAVPEDTHETGAKKFIAAIRMLNRNMNIPEKLIGIDKKDIPTMARYAEKEANPLYPVPVLMDRKQLEQFYYQIADWSVKK